MFEYGLDRLHKKHVQKEVIFMQKYMFRNGIFFLIPSFLIILIFTIMPILQSLYYSFTDYNGYNDPQFIWLDNYLNIFSDPRFKSALIRTLIIGFSTAILCNLFGLLSAILLNTHLITKKILRALFYIPTVIPVVVVAMLWSNILKSKDGLVNLVLSKLLNHPVEILWLDSLELVVYSVIFVSVWQLTGPIIFIYLAGLQGIPKELIDASRIDGASRMNSFRHVTLPLLMPSITINCFVGLANGLNIFDLPYVMTGGGPAGGSETLPLLIYRFAFSSGEIAYGNASSFILALFVISITSVLVFFLKRQEKELV